ncbi:Uncharacterised protein [Vibrio cholerae]|nr:Uncharacterised protein [Vibrio cholerae]
MRRNIGQLIGNLRGKRFKAKRPHSRLCFWVKVPITQIYCLNFIQSHPFGGGDGDRHTVIANMTN